MWFIYKLCLYREIKAENEYQSLSLCTNIACFTLLYTYANTYTYIQIHTYTGTHTHTHAHARMEIQIQIYSSFIDKTYM